MDLEIQVCSLVLGNFHFSLISVFLLVGPGIHRGRNEHHSLTGILWVTGYTFHLALREMHAKGAVVQKTIARNEKTITHGSLQLLQTKNNGTLIYTIDNQTLTVIMASQPLAFVGANYLTGAQVRVYSVPVSSKQQLLLAVVYEQMPPVHKQILTISATEKANNNNKKDSLEALKITSIILGILSVVSSFFFTGGGILVIIGVYLFCFILIASIIYFTYRQIEAYTEKLVITGVVTEQLRIRYRIGRHGSYRQMNWYRIGNELAPGTLSDQDGLQAGDTARFEFYAGKKGKRHSLIRVIKI